MRFYCRPWQVTLVCIGRAGVDAMRCDVMRAVRGGADHVAVFGKVRARTEPTAQTLWTGGARFTPYAPL